MNLALFMATAGPLLAQGNGGSPWGLLPSMVVIFMLFYFLMIRPERQKQHAHRERLASLKKNDRVITVGGIHGVVTNIHREADQVTLKVDESSGTKIPFTLGSISQVITGSEDDSGKK